MSRDRNARLLAIADRMRAGGAIEPADAEIILAEACRRLQPGERRLDTRLRLAERNRLICRCAPFFQGCPTERAREIAAAQKRLATTAWARRRPPPADDTKRVLLWRTLELNHGEPLGARRIRQILAESAAYSFPANGETTSFW